MNEDNPYNKAEELRQDIDEHRFSNDTRALKHRETVEDLMNSGFSKEVSERLVKMFVKNEIRHIYYNY